MIPTLAVAMATTPLTTVTPMMQMLATRRTRGAAGALACHAGPAWVAGTEGVLRRSEEPAQAAAVTTLPQCVDGTGAAFDGQSVVTPQGPSLGLGGPTHEKLQRDTAARAAGWPPHRYSSLTTVHSPRDSRAERH